MASHGIGNVTRTDASHRIGSATDAAQRLLLMGNQACAWAALAAGVRVVAGYPGTPSSELIDTIAGLHRQGVAHDVHVEWSDNEKAALEVLQGASLAGARCLFTCKQMGLNVASDALMSLNYVGTKGGLVLYVADDPGPISSQTEQDTRRYASFAKVPVLDPSTPEEAADMVSQAFDLSEEHEAPVIVRPTTRICHATAFFDVPLRTQARAATGFERNSDWVIFPKRSYVAHKEVNDRLQAISDELGVSGNPCRTIVGAGSDVVGTAERGAADSARALQDARDKGPGIVFGGISSAYAREAIRILESKAQERHMVLPPLHTMQITSPYPFPKAKAATFLSECSDVLVFEELDNVIEDALTQVVGSNHLAANVHGKLDRSTLERGENSTDDCLVRIARFLGVENLVQEGSNHRDGDASRVGDAPEVPGDGYDDIQPPQRPPVLCAGCPHRGSFYAVKKAIGARHRDQSVWCGDIGCYTLGNAQPLDAVATCLCMGGGVTMAQGIACADPDKKALAFIGDSTFFASGMTGIANAVYNQHDITVFVLDNSTTAMTGGQPHPGTGQTLMGPKSDPIQIESVLCALGMKCVEKADPLYLDESVQVAKKAIAFPGPSAVIYKAPCAQYTPKQPACKVDPEACIACRICIKTIGCPAISMRDDVSCVEIDENQCNGCGLCVDVCPKDALSVPSRRQGDAR